MLSNVSKKLLGSPVCKNVGSTLVVAGVVGCFKLIWTYTGEKYFTLQSMHKAYDSAGSEGLISYLLDEGIAKTDAHAEELVAQYEDTYCE